MDADAVAERIEAAIPDAEASVERNLGHRNEQHYTARVVSPSFEGKSLVEQHQLVHDALEDELTADIHALQLETLTPDEAD
jgi:stress-induced morphogen